MCRFIRKMNKLKYYHTSDKQDWGTPQFIYDALNKEFGFTLDVCANKENAKCSKYFTEQDDAIKQDWSNDVCFMNPPYNLVDAFMQKAWDESQKGAIVVCLIPARIDASWWHKYVMKSEWRLFTQRLEFEGHKKNRAPFPSAVVVFRPPNYKVGVFDITRSDARKSGYDVP